MLSKVTCLLLIILAFALPALPQTKATRDERMERGREFLGLAPSADPAAAARGQTLFSQNCAFCHGVNAKGAEGPDLVRSTLVLHDEHGELIGPVVLKGRADRGMPAFSSFTTDQIADLAAFLHSRVEAAANRFGYKVLNVVTGDAKKGGQFFAARCESCHQASGDLAHIASKAEPVDLQTLFLYPSGEKPVVTAVVTLPSGEQVKGKLKELDDFSISLWDDAGACRVWARNGVKVAINDPLSGHRELLAVYSNDDMHNMLAYLETLK